MPDSPHLTWSVCGYTLLTLEGLSPDISSSQVTEVYINGVVHDFRILLPSTIMLIPSFKQEAQRVRIELKQKGQETAPDIKSNSIRSTPPPPLNSYGLTPPETPRKAPQ